MRVRVAILTAGAILACGSGWCASASSTPSTTQAAPGPCRPAWEPTWESLKQYSVPDWYRDAKFGIFIHWGAYAVPAYKNEWYPCQMYKKGSDCFKHHITHYGPLSTFGYKDFIPSFRGENWDPQEWVALFQEAGARYVVPVGEHHDGFAMYDCSRTRWNAVKMGPRRDVVGELAEAVRAAGLKFGVSSHRAYHWFYYTYDEDFDTTDPANAGLYGSPHPPDAPPDEAFLEDWYARTKEIVDKYQPDLMWFDFGISRPVFEPYRRRFAAYYYQKASDWGRPVVLNYKGDAFAESAAVLDIERGRLDALRALPWQTDTSVCRRSWGYIQNPDYKEAGEIIDLLVDVVSKNGCLLLNVGPRPDGTIPELQQMLLRRIGGWLKINGEAIHGTRPFRIYGEGPTKIASGRMGEKENRQRYTAADIRFTRRPHVIYAICLDWPGQTATIRSLGHKTGFMDRRIAQVNLLGHRIPLRWVRRTDRLTVEMPARPPCEAAYVLKIILKRS